MDKQDWHYFAFLEETFLFEPRKEKKMEWHSVNRKPRNSLLIFKQALYQSQQTMQILKSKIGRSQISVP